MSKAKYMKYMSIHETLKMTIETELQAKYQEVIHHDPDRSEVLAEEMSKLQRESKKRLAKVMAKVHEKHQVELPFVTSTPSTSFIVQGNINQHTRNQENADLGGTGQKSANYKYRLQDIPTFNGQP